MKNKTIKIVGIGAGVFFVLLAFGPVTTAQTPHIHDADVGYGVWERDETVQADPWWLPLGEAYLWVTGGPRDSVFGLDNTTTVKAASGYLKEMSDDAMRMAGFLGPFID